MANESTKFVLSAASFGLTGGDASLSDVIAGMNGGGDGTKFLAGDGTLKVPADIDAAAGRHAVTTGEATATTLNIATGKTVIAAQIVQILRAGVVVTGDAVVTVTAGTITVANGASTYTLTAADVINWIAF